MKLFGNKHGAEQNTASFQAVREPDRNTGPKKHRGGLIALGVIGILAAVLVLLFAVAAVLTAKLDTVFPKVTMGGYELGGLSLEEAADTLERAGWGDRDNIAVIVEMPGGTCEITYAQAGMELDAQGAAQAAWEYGRDGNVLTNTFTWIRSMIRGADLTDRVFPDTDEGLIRDLVAQAAARAKADLDQSWTIDEEAETLTLIKGAGMIVLDEDTITRLVLDAIDQGSFGTVTYDPPEQTDVALDADALREEICREAADAYYDKETDTIVPEQVGIDFDAAEAREKWNAARTGDEVVLDVTITRPEETAEHLESVLFQTVLAEKSTSLAGSNSNRLNNVELAAKAVNGVVLMPGEQFSYNGTLGQRTRENGYLPAGAYSNGAVVQEVGGGICQVSSTLYYCTLQSNLQIDYRVNHYFPVGYLPAGFDATVSWKSPDFKFTNDREYPIKLEAFVENGYMTVRILGTDDGTYVELSSTSWLIYTNKDYPETATGYKAEAFRAVYDSETHQLIEKHSEGVSTYYYHEEDIKYPEPEPSPEPSPEPTPEPEPTPTPAPEPSPEPSTEPEPVETPTPQEIS